MTTNSSPADIKRNSGWGEPNSPERLEWTMAYIRKGLPTEISSSSAVDGLNPIGAVTPPRANPQDKVDLELYDRMKAAHPSARFNIDDLCAKRLFDRGDEMVQVRHDVSAPDWKGPTMSLVKTWDEYIKVRTWASQVLTQDEARLRYAWRGQPSVPKSPTRREKVFALVDDLRAQDEAKRIVQAERNPAVPLKLESVADLLNKPAPEWWVEGVLPKDAVVIVGGDGGVGKSALIVELVARLSTGTAFLESHPTLTARTLYAVGEGISGYGQRFSAVRQAHGLDPEQVRVVSQGVDLTSERSMEQVRVIVSESKIDIVIFDTLSSLSTLESENDAAEVARVLNNAKGVREANPGCTVIIVHHTNKASGGLRGSSVIRDNADMVWMLRGDPDAFFMSSKSKHGGKVKDGEPKEIHGLSLVGAYGSVVVESATMPVEGPASADRRGLGLAKKLEPGAEYAIHELRELVRRDDPDTSDATIKRAITALLAAGQIESIGRGRYKGLAGQNSGGSMTLTPV